MRKITKTEPKVPDAPKPTPPAPVIDIEAVLARQAEALTKSTEAMVGAVREEIRGIATMVVESRKGKVRVEIERDRDGRMSNLIIEKISTPAKRVN